MQSVYSSPVMARTEPSMLIFFLLTISVHWGSCTSTIPATSVSTPPSTVHTLPPWWLFPSVSSSITSSSQPANISPTPSPKTCFACEDLLDPRTCNVTMKCQDWTDQCYVEAVSTVSLQVVHQLGCAVRKLCQEAQLNQGHVGTVFGRRQADKGWTACVSCCEGDLCNRRFCQDNCRAQPCQNNGTCSTSGLASYNCTCPPGFQGDNCERNVDECACSPCQNGGTCADGVNGFACTCPVGYYGDTCLASQCDSSPCVNGDCLVDNSNGSFVCKCYAGYEGRNCQTNIDDCRSSPCTHGGRCTDLVADFRCECPLKFKGKQCESEHTELVCMACQGIRNLADCWNYTLCAPGEQCYTFHTMTVAGVAEYTMGCRPQAFCNALPTVLPPPSPQLQGRQVAHQITLCAECCNEDLCNRRLCSTGASVSHCLQCQGVRSVDQCRNAGACPASGICYMEEVLDPRTGERLQNFGCMREGFCHFLSTLTGVNATAVAQLKGGDTDCFRCCSGHYCNGHHCNACTSQPCLSGGTCVDQGDTFTCRCPLGKSGKFCEI